MRQIRFIRVADRSVQKQGGWVRGREKHSTGSPVVRQWLAGDRLAYLVITVAVGIGSLSFLPSLR